MTEFQEQLVVAVSSRALFNLEAEHQLFEKEGYARKDEDKIELTNEGREYLHNFIMEETEKVIKLIKEAGGRIYLEKLLKQVDYGTDTEEFLDYLLTNESKKASTRIIPLGGSYRKYGNPPQVELMKKS